MKIILIYLVLFSSIIYSQTIDSTGNASVDSLLFAKKVIPKTQEQIDKRFSDIEKVWTIIFDKSDTSIYNRREEIDYEINRNLTGISIGAKFPIANFTDVYGNKIDSLDLIGKTIVANFWFVG